MSDKVELRQIIREKLLRLNPVEIDEHNTKITQDFLSSQSFMPHSNIACYMPLKGETSCVGIMQSLNTHGHTLCLPAVVARNLPLLFRHYRPGDSLIRGMLGPFEPTTQSREIIPDTLVIPMLGFTRDGYRLGYGSGLYDRTIASLRQLKPIKTIGLAFSMQEIDSMPIEAHDMKLDIIITEKEIIENK